MPAARDRTSTSSGLRMGIAASTWRTCLGASITIAFITIPLSRLWSRTSRFVCKVRYCQPAFAQIVRRHFWLAISREHALFVALDTRNSLAGREIREVPNLLPDAIRELVQYFMNGLQACHLVFLGKHNGCCIMKTRNGVGAIFSEHDWLAW